MKTKTILFGVSLLGALALSLSAFAAPRSATLVIHHQLHGCHAWSLNGGPFVVHQSLRLARGGSLTVTNNDMMVQDLIKTSGRAVVMKLVRPNLGTMGMAKGMHMDMDMGKPSPYAMAHMGAQVRVTFRTAGTYHFKLVDRGDYVKNIETIGDDNKPTLTVLVS